MELSRVARIATRLLLFLILFVVCLLVVAAGGLFFYKSDLPDITALSVFAPEATTTIPDIYICGKKATVEAVPTGRITNLRSALLAAEGDVDQRSIIGRLYDYFLHQPEHYGHYSMQLSQGLFCDDHRRILTRELSEFRTSIQLERRFTTDQLLDIYLNRTYFGPDVYGIESAAEHYIGKPASQLSVAEAALLVGLIKSPTRFSPLAHPDRAVARRNEVIDTMSKRGNITPEQAEKAKATPMSAVAETTRDHT